MIFGVIANWIVIVQFNAFDFPLRRSSTFQEDFRNDYVMQINYTQPDFVLLGDSALTMVDEELFHQAMRKPTLVYRVNGSASAYWYLFLRNQIIPSPTPPAAVVFVFRTSMLTTPNFRVFGKYLEQIEEIALPKDKDIYDLTINANKSIVERWLESYLPIYAYRSEIYNSLVNFLRNLLPYWWMNCDAECVDDAFEQVYDDKQINEIMWEAELANADDSLNQSANLNFDRVVHDSLLPMMIEDCVENGITPVFVRARHRSHAQGIPDSPSLQAYLSALSSYILEHGGVYLDLATSWEIMPQMFTDNVHLLLEYKPIATRVLARRILEVLGE